MEDLDNILNRFRTQGMVVPGRIDEEEKISFTFHSTAIEGSSLTYEEVYLLLKDNIGGHCPPGTAAKSSCHPLSPDKCNLFPVSIKRRLLSPYVVPLPCG